MQNQKMLGNNRGLTVAGLLAIVAIVGVLFSAIFLVKIRTVDGNEIGVLETWSDGVVNEPLTPKTYVFFPGFNKSVYTYTTSGQVFAMNDKDDAQEPFAHGRRSDVLVVNSLDNQQVRFHITLTWRIDPTHVVSLHKNYRDNIEERLIRPEIVNEVGIRATLQNAIDLYSGPKLNALRELVNAELRNPNGKLAQSGVIVDRFVIEKPKLNPDYEKVIESRQLAIATESQAREQQKANVAIAEAAKAAALKGQYEAVVAAETSKQRGILEQEAISQKAIIEAAANAKNTIVEQNAASEKIVLAATAEAKRNIAISEAQKQAEINRAVGIKAVGEATAEANKLLLSSFSVPGSDLYTRIQVAKSLGESFQNVRGYLPANVSYNLVAENFDKGVSLMLPAAAPAK
jgi:regulator of protease activity HflC (stomatin/prohibitin superfamily)